MCFLFLRCRSDLAPVDTSVSSNIFASLKPVSGERERGEGGRVNIGHHANLKMLVLGKPHDSPSPLYADNDSMEREREREERGEGGKKEKRLV